VRAVVAYRQSPQGLRELVASANKIGEAQLIGKNPKAARESYLHGLELTRQVPPTDFKQHQSDLRFVLGRLGDTEVALFRYDAAVARYREALAEVEKRVAADPLDPRGRNEHAFVMQKLASALQLQFKYAEALEWHRKALAGYEANAQSEPANAEFARNVAVAHALIGELLSARGDVKGASKSLETSLGMYETLSAQDPGSRQKQFDVMENYQMLIQNEERAGRFQEAAHLVERARQSLRGMAERPGMTPSLRAAIEFATATGLAVYRAADQAIEDEASISARPPEIALRLKRLRALQLARIGRREEAARLGAEMARSQSSDASTLVDVARVDAICAGPAASTTTTPAPQQARDYGDRSVDSLAVAIKLQGDSLEGSSFQPDFESIAHHPRLASILQIEP
jgi:tetratricopeptide (TPR) repeat protein